MGIHLDSSEILAYQVANLAETIPPEGIPLRSDEEQVGHEDLDVLESSDPLHHGGATSDAMPLAGRW